MPSDLHPLERRAAALADAFSKRVDIMAGLMKPPGQPPIFHQRLPDQQALEFWQRHRYDDLGQSVLQTWAPDQVLDLDRRLMQAGGELGVG